MTPERSADKLQDLVERFEWTSPAVALRALCLVAAIVYLCIALPSPNNHEKLLYLLLFYISLSLHWLLYAALSLQLLPDPPWSHPSNATDTSHVFNSIFCMRTDYQKVVSVVVSSCSGEQGPN